MTAKRKTHPSDSRPWDAVTTGDVEGDLARVVALRQQNLPREAIIEATGLAFKRVRMLIRLAKKRGLIPAGPSLQPPGTRTGSTPWFELSDPRDFIVKQDALARDALASTGTRYCDHPRAITTTRHLPVTHPPMRYGSAIGSPLGAVTLSGDGR